MNTIHKHTLSALGAGLALLLLAGCDNKTQYGISAPDSAPSPGTISGITADNSTPGQIVLKWKNDMVEGQETLYTKVTYFDPYVNKEVVKTVSAEELIIPGTYVAAGEYVFTLTPVNAALQEGTSETFTARSTPRPLSYKPTAESNPMTLSVDMLSTNAQDPTEGPIENAIDGQLDTYFHTTWQGANGDIGERHYIQISMDEFPLYVRIWITPRQNKPNDIPKDAELWIYDGNEWKDAGLCHFPKLEDITKPAYFIYDVMPEIGENYDILLPEGTKAIRIENISTHGGNTTWFNLSEIGMEEVIVETYDAEAEAKKVIDANMAQ